MTNQSNTTLLQAYIEDYGDGTLMLDDGVHEELTYEQYARIPRINRGLIIEALKSQRHIDAALSGQGRPDSDALRLGRVVHQMVLERRTLDTSCLVLPDVSLTSKAGRAEAAEWCEDIAGKAGRAEDYVRALADDGVEPGSRAAFGVLSRVVGRELVSVNELATIQCMVASLNGHARAKAILSHPGREVTCLWTDQHTGLACKARIDVSCAEIVDLKTTTDASYAAMQRDAAKYMLHVQGAWYLRAARDTGINCDGFSLLCVEKASPYNAVVYPMSRDAIEHGWSLCLYALAQIKEYLEEPTTPKSYDDRVLDLPPWAMRSDA